MNKTNKEFTKARKFYCDWMNVDLDDVVNEVDQSIIKCMAAHAQQYAYQQAMAYEEWLCEIGATKTISARPDYTDFINHQNQQ